MARTADPNRRSDIMAAARAAFVERGYAQTRIADVAARAGVAPGTIYLYFESKEAILVALVDRFFERLAAITLPMLRQAPPAAAIANAVRAAFAFTAEERDLLKLVHLDTGLATLTSHSNARLDYYRALTEHLAEEMERGHLRRYDPAVLATLCAGLIERAAEACLLFGQGDLPTYEENLIALLHHALLP